MKPTINKSIIKYLAHKGWVNGGDIERELPEFHNQRLMKAGYGSKTPKPSVER